MIRTSILAIVVMVGSMATAQEFIWSRSTAGTDAAKLRPGEVPVEKAMEAAADFLKKAGLPLSTSKPRVSRAENKTWSEWLMIYGGDYMFWVNTKSAKVTTFENLAAGARDERLGRTGKVAFQNPIALYTYARGVMKRLGLPEGLPITATRFSPDNDPAVGNGQERGVISVLFAAKPHGFLHYLDSNSVVLVFDPQDGLLTRYTNTLDMFSVESWAVNVSLDDAKAIANRIAQAHDLEKPRVDQLDFVAAGKSELLYVIPNGWFGAPESDYRLPYKCRLAWVIRFPYGHSVWVDAGDGKILGGRGPGTKKTKPKPER